MKPTKDTCTSYYVTDLIWTHNNLQCWDSNVSLVGFMIDCYGDSKIESAANTHVATLWY